MDGGRGGAWGGAEVWDEDGCEVVGVEEASEVDAAAAVHGRGGGVEEEHGGCFEEWTRGCEPPPLLTVIW